MPDTTTPQPHPDADATKTLVYGYGDPFADGGLIFLPLEEARRYGELKRADGFPMTWGEFRRRFGEDLYAEFWEPVAEASDYRSFDEFFAEEYVSPAYRAGTLEAPFAWAEWYKDFRRRVGPRTPWQGTLYGDPGRNIAEPGRACSDFHEYWSELTAHPTVAASEVPDWFHWYRTRSHDGPDTLAGFEDEINASLARNAARLRAEVEEEAREEYEDVEHAPEDDETWSCRSATGNWNETPTSIDYWPEQRMLDWFPKELVRRFGRIDLSVHDGEFLYLPTGREEEIIAELEALGYSCVPDDEKLIQTLTG